MKSEKLTDMKDQELHDIFHAYRPESDDEDAFMDKLIAQMDAIDAQQQTNASRAKQQSRIVPFYRRILPWAMGIAAAVLVAFVLIKGPDSPLAPLPNRGGVGGEAFEDGRELPANLFAPSMMDFSSTYDEIVNEVEQSGQQLQLAIAEMKK